MYPRLLDCAKRNVVSRRAATVGKKMTEKHRRKTRAEKERRKSRTGASADGERGLSQPAPINSGNLSGSKDPWRD